MSDDAVSTFWNDVGAHKEMLCAKCPDLDVFEVAHRRLLVCAPTLDLGAPGLDQENLTQEHILMNRIRAQLERAETEDEQWALAFVDIWYCSNFSADVWRQIVRRDHRDVRYAIQAALFVMRVSGSAGFEELAALIAETDSTEEARSYLQTLTDSPERELWMAKVLGT